MTTVVRSPNDLALLVITGSPDLNFTTQPPGLLGCS
jgi:hypothetical protein